MFLRGGFVQLENDTDTFLLVGGGQTSANSSGYAFNIPHTASMVNLICVGGGGGGGAGFASTSGTNRGGGGGGGSGYLGNFIIPRIAIPETIYVNPGLGGSGAVNSGESGTAGTTTFVSTLPFAVNAGPSILAIAPGGTGGSPGTGAAGGTGGGSSGEFPTIDNYALASFGFIKKASTPTGGSDGGAPGAAGGALTNRFIGGGSGGGSVSSTNVLYDGGLITTHWNRIGANPLNTVYGPNGRDGQDGIQFLNPLFFTGGSGGRGSNTSAGGKGGDGAPGCGGGGGGAGLSPGGPGGKGGDGFVIISYW